MGSAMKDGWLNDKPSLHIDVVDPHADIHHDRVTVYKSINDIETTKDHAMIVLAVKPQIMDDVCRDLATLNPQSPLLSIAAGWSTEKIAALFSNTPPIIRTMPNMPAAIGKGMLVSYANGQIDNYAKTLAETLLGPLGEHIWVDDEDLIHAVTALSGSGPAYIFALTKAMTDAGTAIGLPADIVEKLARQTVTGSAAYMATSTKSAQELVDSIAVQGGTTEAAMNIINNNNALESLMTKALQAAKEKSESLGK